MLGEKSYISQMVRPWRCTSPRSAQHWWCRQFSALVGCLHRVLLHIFKDSQKRSEHIALFSTYARTTNILTYGKPHQVLHDRELLGEAVAGLKLGLLQVLGRLLRPWKCIFSSDISTFFRYLVPNSAMIIDFLLWILTFWEAQAAGRCFWKAEMWN